MMMIMMMMKMMIIILIVTIIILLVVQLLLLLLLLLLLSLLPSSSSFFCVSECFLTGVWLFDIHFVSLGKPFICSRPSNGSAVCLLSLFYLFIYLFCQLSLNPFSFFIRFLLRSVGVRRVRRNKIK